nr:ABC transporter substrate-binding protein [Rubeoparvulum massiliense]
MGAFALSLALLAGCSSNDSKQSSSTGTGDGKEVVVGISQFVEHPSLDEAQRGFRQALKDAGFEEGKNLRYEVHNAQNDMNNTGPIAQKLVGDKVDLIFANATPNAMAALSVTEEIPIIFTSVTDPIGAQLITAMDQPGPNITGTTDNHPDAIPNTIKFMDQYFPGTRVGMIFNAGEQNSVAQVEMARNALQGTDLTIVDATVSTSAEVKQAAESLVGRVDFFYIITDNTVVSALESVISVAQDNKIPLFVGELDSVKRGGFAAYGFEYYDIGYEAGEMAVQILKGEKTPEQLPAKYPQNLKLLINKGAAEAMGVELQGEWEQIAEYYE